MKSGRIWRARPVCAWQEPCSRSRNSQEKPYMAILTEDSRRQRLRRRKSTAILYREAPSSHYREFCLSLSLVIIFYKSINKRLINDSRQHKSIVEYHEISHKLVKFKLWQRWERLVRVWDWCWSTQDGGRALRRDALSSAFLSEDSISNLCDASCFHDTPVNTGTVLHAPPRHRR